MEKYKFSKQELNLGNKQERMNIHESSRQVCGDYLEKKSSISVSL